MVENSLDFSQNEIIKRTLEGQKKIENSRNAGLVPAVFDYPWWHRPNTCPGCGRCNHCGRGGYPGDYKIYWGTSTGSEGTLW